MSTSPAETHSRLLTERELAAYLSITPRTAINLRQRGALPFFRVGRNIRYRLSAIDEALIEGRIR